MIYNDFEIKVLVKGRPINEYPHNLQTFVEGRDGSAFEIELTNKSANRVEAVIAVDGLSVIDGKDAGPQSSGYIVDAHASIRIPGWKLSDEQVAAFVFAGKKTSYAAQSTGSTRNTGVIGAMVFSEKNPRPAYVNQLTAAFPGYQVFGSGQPSFGYQGQPVSGGYVYPSGTADMIGSGMIWNSTDVLVQSSYTSAAAASATLGANTSGQMRSRTKSIAPQREVKTRGGLFAAAPEVVEQTLGTEFGKAQDFATESVTFERGDMKAMLVLYYDDSRGLKARGIELARPSKRRVQQQPQAFPAMNCQPPKGWKG